MLVQALLVCLFANICLAQSTDFVTSGIHRPKGVSIDQHNDNIRDYWTFDRLKAAKSLDIILRTSPSGRSSANVNISTGPTSSVPGTLPANSSIIGRAITSNGRQVATTGKVFFRGVDGNYMCSAAIVSSITGDLVSTAGHCVFDTDKKAWFNSYWVFIPAYANGNKPYGTWPARNFIALKGWTDNRNFDYDVAFVALSTVNGRHIQSYLGAQGIGFNFARLQYTHAFGYPGNLNNGEVLRSCVANTQSPTGAGSYRGQRLPCNMGGGSSGGPWLQNVNEATGVGYVTSVNSFGFSSIPNFMYGPYFDSTIGSLYDSAKKM